MLHTLGDGLSEIFKVIEREEWRPLTNTEKCAVGILFRNIGDDMQIPFDLLPSDNRWRNGLHFANELRDWTRAYEERVARLTQTNEQYVRAYVDSAVDSLPSFVGATLKGKLATEPDEVMMTSLG